MQLRCPGNKVHGETVGETFGTLEVFCQSRWCGKRPDVVVVHRFNLVTGSVTTRQYKQPTKSTEVDHVN